jgi:hypothetical protein
LRNQGSQGFVEFPEADFEQIFYNLPFALLLTSAFTSTLGFLFPF